MDARASETPFHIDGKISAFEVRYAPLIQPNF